MSCAASAARPDEVELWAVRLDLTPTALARARELLDVAERERVARLIGPRQRARAIASGAALRRVLAGYLALSPEELALERAPGLRPRLRGEEGLAFNLTHSGDVAAVAVTQRAAVGIDVEMLGRRTRARVVCRALAPQELVAVRRRAPARREEAFLRHWTAKEAFVKARGGLAGEELAAVVVQDAYADARLAGRSGWSLRRYDPAPGVVGAVVAAGGPWRARRRYEADLSGAVRRAGRRGSAR